MSLRKVNFRVQGTQVSGKERPCLCCAPAAPCKGNTEPGGQPGGTCFSARLQLLRRRQRSRLSLAARRQSTRLVSHSTRVSARRAFAPRGSLGFSRVCQEAHGRAPLASDPDSRGSERSLQPPRAPGQGEAGARPARLGSTCQGGLCARPSPPRAPQDPEPRRTKPQRRQPPALPGLCPQRALRPPAAGQVVRDRPRPVLHGDRPTPSIKTEPPFL